MSSSQRGSILKIVLVAVPLLCLVTAAEAAQCTGYKVVQNCTTTGGMDNIGACSTYEPGSGMYESCLGSQPKIGGITTCTPMKVPCDYPTNIFELFSNIFNSPDR